MSAVGDLAERSDGYYRVPLTDALIAAAAEHGGIALLHRDTHFDKLAEVLTFETSSFQGPEPSGVHPTPPAIYETPLVHRRCEWGSCRDAR